MSMETIKGKTKFVTQQYISGLYVCLYDKKTGRMLEQGCLPNITETEFHKKLREAK